MLCKAMISMILLITTKKMTEKFYKTEDLAEMLKVNIMTIYRYIKAKKLKAYKIGKEYRIDKEEFNVFLNGVKTK